MLPSYNPLQLKAYTRWCNIHLETKGLRLDLTNPDTDFHNGVLLLDLLEILSYSNFRGRNQQPREDLENLTLAFKIMDSQGIRFTNFGPEDILNSGNTNLVIEIIWRLILKFQFKSKFSEENSVNQELLEWVCSKIPEYKITDFYSDWYDGKSICALIDSVFKRKIQITTCLSRNGILNWHKAIEIANTEMNIPKIFDAEDVFANPDSHVIMTYLTYFRNFKNPDQEDEELRKQILENKEEQERMAQQQRNELEKAEELSYEIQRMNLQEVDPKMEDLKYYYEQIEKDKKYERQTKIHIPNCVANGPGLISPGMQAVEAKFIIEARNIDNSLTGLGGDPFMVSITGTVPGNIPLEVVDNGNGEYLVKYTPITTGNYVIGITIFGQSISGSPFTVNVLKYKTAPTPHWYFLEAKKYWPYDDPASDKIETAWQSLMEFNSGKGTTHLNHRGHDFTINFEEMKQRSPSSSSRKILRGTWFYYDDDNRWTPYSPELAYKLEDEFQKDVFNRVEVSFKPLRYVKPFNDGFRQFRQSKNANKEGRAVQRGYQNKHYTDAPKHLLVSPPFKGPPMS